MNRIFGIVLAVLCSVCLFCGYYAHKMCSKPVIVEGKDTVLLERWVRDTVVIKVPQIRVRHDTAWLCQVRDTIVRDTVWAQVEVPITQTKYQGENYRATVEGYRARLTDIEVATKTMVVTQKLAAPRWSLGVSAGPMVGYGFTPKGWQPVAGAGVIVGVQYRF